MHDDIVPELLERIKKDFNKQLQKSKIISDLKHRLQTKEATYIDVNSYAIEVGNILSTVISKYVTEDVLPDGRMYYNIANRLLNDVLPNNHELITGYGSNVQKLLNDKAKLSFIPQVPELNQDKIDGLVNRLSHEKEFRKIKKLLGDPIVTFSQGVVDDIIEKNVDFHYKSGLRPQIIRKESGNCCDWCRALVGRFDYPDVPKDVYRRHGNCRCTVEYDPKSGKRQNVHTKQWKTSRDIKNVEIIDGVDRSDLPYKSVKDEWLRNYKQPKIIEMDYWEHEGVKYYVDGHNVKYEPSAREIEVAHLLAKKYGVEVRINPKVGNPNYIRSSDFLINGRKFDLKEIEGSGKNNIDTRVHSAKGQADNVIVDVSNSVMKDEDAIFKIDLVFKSARRNFVNEIILLRGEKVIEIFRRK